jgi:hypothetical protein
MMKALSLFLIAIFAIITNLAYAKEVTSVNRKTTVAPLQMQSKSISQEDRYAAYKVDGFTSASKLAAQRSHTVAGKDERNFAIFSGISVILIVYFFSQFDFFDE